MPAPEPQTHTENGLIIGVGRIFTVPNAVLICAFIDIPLHKKGRSGDNAPSLCLVFPFRAARHRKGEGLSSKSKMARLIKMVSGKRRWELVFYAFVCLLLAAPAPFHAAQTKAPQGSAGSDLHTLLQEVISKLSGNSEIRPGVKLANRFSIENRQEARNYLADLLKRFGMIPRRQAYGTEGENIFTILPCGKTGAETIVFGAHYDSARNSPGANDDGSGVAAVIGVAREMNRVRKRSKDIIFVFFDEEERGLRGSRAFAQMLLDEKRAIHSVHTIDQMGWDQDADRAIELELPYEGAPDLYAQAAGILMMKIPMLTTKEAGSDHSAFRKLGFKAVGITEEYRNKDTTPYIHRPGDTYETVDFAYLGSTTKLIAQVMKILAR